MKVGEEKKGVFSLKDWAADKWNWIWFEFFVDRVALVQEVVLEEQGVFSKTSRVEESSFKILFGTSGSSLFAACLPTLTSIQWDQIGQFLYDLGDFLNALAIIFGKK